MTSTEPRTEQANDKVSLPTLTAMVVGSMIGSGVFLLPRRFGTETGVARGDHRLDHRRHRNVDAGLRLSASGDPQTGSGCGNLRVCQGRVRRLRRVQFGDRVLGIRLCGQYLVLGAHHGNDERAGARIRCGRHGARSGRIGDRCVAFRLPRVARRQGCGRHQLHCHHCQGRADPGVYRDRDHRVQGRHLRRQLLGRRRVLVRPRCGTRQPARC